MRLRLTLLHFSTAVLFSVILGRLAYLQIWRHEDLVARVEQQSSRVIRPAPRRGPLLDRAGRVLAESSRTASCYADPSLIHRPDQVAHRLAGPLGMPAGEIARKIKDSKASFVWLKRFLPVESAQAVEAANILGIGLKWEYRRSYPEGRLAAPLLGYVGDDGHGLSGVELAFDKELIEVAAPRRSLRDGKGRGLTLSPGGRDREEKSRVTLAIDRTLQYIAERELELGLKRSGCRSGVVVVQDPSTGDLLAVASRERADSAGRPGEARDLRLPAAHWVFEPGSTFKLITAAAALEEKVVRPQEVMSGENGKYKLLGRVIRDHEGKGLMTFHQAFEVSSNVVFAKLGLRLGKEKFYDYVRAFGFGARTGSEIPGEEMGLLRPIRRWSGLSLPVISFGQEIGVTAIQLASAYSAVANGGTLLEPRIFRESAGPDGNVRRWKTPSPVRRVASPETCRALTAMMRGVVERGTGQDARLAGWQAAGKTGTAQKIDPAKGVYSTSKYVASFCGFAPAERPRLVVVVIMDEPKGPEWGGHNAGPVFKGIMEHALAYLNVPPDAAAPVAGKPASGPRKT